MVQWVVAQISRTDGGIPEWWCQFTYIPIAQ